MFDDIKDWFRTLKMRATPPCQECEYYVYDQSAPYYRADKCECPYALDMDAREYIREKQSLLCFDVRGTRDCKFKKRSKESATS